MLSIVCDGENGRKKLASLLHIKPLLYTQVVLVTRNYGKTATLDSYLQGKKNIIYIDCPEWIVTSSPTTFLWVHECLL